MMDPVALVTGSRSRGRQGVIWRDQGPARSRGRKGVIWRDQGPAEHFDSETLRGRSGRVKAEGRELWCEEGV